MRQEPGCQPLLFPDGCKEALTSFELAWRAFVQRLSLAAVEIIMPLSKHHAFGWFACYGRLSSFNIRQGLASGTFLGRSPIRTAAGPWSSSLTRTW